MAAQQKCQVAIVGCGLPGRGMGWYHSLNILEGEVPSAELTDVVEPWFLGAGKDTPGGQEFAQFASQHPSVRFHSSVADMPPADSIAGEKKLAIIAGRTADNPRLLEEVIGKGCATVFLEKPGAPSVSELEAMAASASRQGARVFMGYNKCVTQYVSEALEAAKGKGGATTTTYFHNNDYKPTDLPECFERNKEGMLKNMAVHELCLLVQFFGVKADSLASVVADKAFSSCQTLVGPDSKAEFTDFDKLGFTVTTTDGTTVSVYADRCGGSFSEAIVANQADSTEVLFRSRTPNEALLSVVAQKAKDHPTWMPYFLLQHDDYITLKERVCAAALSGGTPDGVATIETAIETLKVAEFLTPTLTKELLA